MKAAILTIGDELLIGQTVDTNASYIASNLNQIGVEIVGKRTVGDKELEIQQGLKDLARVADIVITTGGLGPTKDDITKKAIAGYLQLPMVFNHDVYSLIKDFFKRLGREPTEAHREQAYMPEGVDLLHNRLGTAPGMWFYRSKKYYCHLPGVPYEMKILMEDHVLDKIEKIYNPQILHLTLRTAGAGETQLAEKLTPIEEALPSHLKIAYLPDLGTVRIRLTSKGGATREAREELVDWFKRIESNLVSYVYGYDKESLSEALGRTLRQKGLKVGTAESCTGGHIAYQIITPAGASDYFEGSIVSYSYEAKTRQLGVDPKILKDYGAVSAQTVEAMLVGLLDRLDIDVGIAVSGIAGPTGGTPDKPVGTIWIAYGNKEHIHSKRIQASKHRELNIRYTSNVAINLLRKFLLTMK